MGRYRLTPEAAHDLDEIVAFITGGARGASIRLIDDVEKKCQALADMPGIGRSREELAPDLRSSLVGKYLILHRPDAEGVEIIRVIHGARDIPKLFE